MKKLTIQYDGRIAHEQCGAESEKYSKSPMKFRVGDLITFRPGLGPYNDEKTYPQRKSMFGIIAETGLKMWGGAGDVRVFWCTAADWQEKLGNLRVERSDTLKSVSSAIGVLQRHGLGTNLVDDFRDFWESAEEEETQ